MCGIYGMFDFHHSHKIERKQVKDVIDVMQHRGPDEDGIYTNAHIALGHKRLSIIDLSTGKQPLFNENQTLCIIFNGEIYNFKEIRRSLEAKGHRFRTNSDTESIIHAYEEYGADCVQHLRGMFAFAVWDATAKRLFLARDRLGKKPLYYYMDTERFIFASEVKSILRTGCVKPEVNSKFVDEFLSLGYIISPNTLFKNIKSLPPACSMMVENGQQFIKKYWFLDQVQVGDLSMPTYQERLARLLEDAVSYRMISDVPVGAFLSGGIDSSIIVGLMSKLSDQPVKTFSVGYKDLDQVNELEYARLVSRHFNTEHYEIILEPMDFYDAIPKMLWHLDEPIADQACIPLWRLSNEARRYVTVILSGEGSDELFAGYPIYILMKGIAGYRKIPEFLRSYFLDPLIPRVLGERRGEKYVEWSRLPLSKRYLGDMADLSSSLRKKLYSPEFYSFSRKNSLLNRVKRHYDAVADSDMLSKMQYLDIKTWLVDNLLLKADKMTMAASIELRCPFLDHVFVEFSRRIPSNFKLRWLATKYILKKTYQGFLPKEIINRKKRGFPVPLKYWFKSDLNSVIAEILLDSSTLSRGYFNPQFIQRAIEKQRKNEEDFSKLLWSLLIFEYWHKVFIDK
ncbi:asparagine synthase (glutamine-hydrolyzing) [candidate division KSB1 bacterium]|nr:asparagine synthase (glutamine-hydrolyzing) [candidate division KSB1 bacterium]